MGWELEEVERPLVEQLLGLGWRSLEGDLDDPACSGRSSFSEVVQEDVLRRQVLELNLHQGRPWLDEERLTQAVGALTRIPAHRLMEANRIATELLVGDLRGTGRERERLLRARATRRTPDATRAVE